MKFISNITKEELFDYYIVTNHTRKETMCHFNINKSKFESLLRDFNIKKGKFESFSELKLRVTKEKLEQYYVLENHSWEDTKKYFNLTTTSIDKLIKEYGINKIKNKRKFSEVMANINVDDLKIYYESHTFSDTAIYFNISEDMLVKLVKKLNIQKRIGLTVRELSKIIDKDTFYNYYIEQCHSQQETKEYFNITDSQLIGLIRHYNIFKREKIQNVINRINRDELYQKYVIDNYSPYQLANDINISIDMMYSLIRYYGLSGMRLDSYTRLTSKVSKDELYQFYIADSHSVEETTKNFGITNWELGQLLRFYNIKGKGGTSLYEEKLMKYFPTNVPLITHDRKALGNGKEIDFYFPTLGVGIEFNGTYWHSSLQKEREYHFEKSKIAEERGIRIIHIYEYEWNDKNKIDKLISLINVATKQHTQKIYARKCELRKINNAIARVFNDKNHLQGHRNAQITYGLFYENTLVQTMSFSKTKYNRNILDENSWEIIRSCQKLNVVVIGGISKIFTHFIREWNPNKVFSYCDFNKFDGRGYENIGMKFIGYTGPDMRWVLNFSPDIVVSRNPSKHAELKKQAVAQIWGAGSKKYVWVNDNTTNLVV